MRDEHRCRCCYPLHAQLVAHDHLYHTKAYLSCMLCSSDHKTRLFGSRVLVLEYLNSIHLSALSSVSDRYEFHIIGVQV
jgi:hypothetical protein